MEQPPHRRGRGNLKRDHRVGPHLARAVAHEDEPAFWIRKVPEVEQRKRLANVIQQLQIEGLEKHFPNELSGGQQQRVALARELVMQTGLLMMDEQLEALTLSRRMVVMSKGLVQQVDSPDGVFMRPANVFEAPPASRTRGSQRPPRALTRGYAWLTARAGAADR